MAYRQPMTSINAVTWPVATERLSIRPSRESDAAAFQAYRGLPEVSEWLPRLSTDLEAVQERFREEEFLRRTLMVERDGQVIGDLYLSVSDAWAQAEVQDGAAQQAEIGWALSPRHQGQGLAHEAVSRLVEVCFEHCRAIRPGCQWHLSVKILIVKFSLNTENSIGFLIKAIITQFVLHPEEYGHTSSNSDGQSEYIDKGIQFVFYEISHGDF